MQENKFKKIVLPLLVSIFLVSVFVFINPAMTGLFSLKADDLPINGGELIVNPTPASNWIETTQEDANRVEENSGDSEDSGRKSSSGGGGSGFTPSSESSTGTAKQNTVEEKFEPESKIKSSLNVLIQENPEEMQKAIVEFEDEKAKSVLISKFSGKDLEFVGKFFALELSGKEIEELAVQKGIKAIWVNEIYSIALSDSVSMASAPIAWNTGYTGKNVRIAILDTGIDSKHEMFSGKIVAAKNFTDSNTAEDVLGHGTHVAGIVEGIAPDALLLNAKVLNDFGIGYESQIISGLEWATDPDGNPYTDDGARIVNLSLASTLTDLDTPLNQAIQAAEEKGVIVVVAAGNCGNSCPSSSCNGFTGIGAPANSKYAIAVGAVDDSNVLACFSSGENIAGVGIKPDIVSYGVNIESSLPGNLYASKSGTSMSTAFVSGAAALLLEANPSMSPLRLKDWLEANVKDLGSQGKETFYGSGLLNLQNIVSIKETEFNVPLIQANVPQYVLRNSSILLSSEIESKNSVKEVSAKIFTPSEEIVLQLVKGSSNSWFADFSGTSEFGTYFVEFRAIDDSNLQSLKTVSFDVVSELPESKLDFNALEAGFSYTAPSSIFKNETGDFTVQFNGSSVAAKADAMPQDTTVAYIAKDVFGNIIYKDFVGPKEIVPGTNTSFIYPWGSSVVGDYNMKVEVFVEGTRTVSDEKTTKVTIPPIASIGYFSITPTTIQKGEIVSYSASVSNTGSTDFNAFLEIDFLNEQGLVVKVVSSEQKFVSSGNGVVLSIEEEMDLEAGNYDVNAVIHFDDKTVSTSKPISVSVPATGRIYSVNVPSTVGIDENLIVSIDFENIGSFSLNPSFLLQLIYGEEVIQSTNFGGEEVSSNSSKQFNGILEADAKAGIYDLEISASYSGNSIVEHKAVEVVDYNAPIVLDLNYYSVVKQNEFNLIQAKIFDYSDLNNVTANFVLPSGNEAIAELLRNQSFDSNSFWALAFEESDSIGEYSFKLKSCDVFGNCYETTSYNFSVSDNSSCIGRNVLIASNDEGIALKAKNFLQDYCVVLWPENTAGIPSLNYLLKFDSVLWLDNSIDSNTAFILQEFLDSGGRLLIAGNHIAFYHRNNEFMQSLGSLFSSQSSDFNNLKILRKHPAVLGLSQIDLNTVFSFNNDSLKTLHDANALLYWENGEGAAVLKQDTSRDSKSILFAFSFNGLNESDLNSVLNNSVYWLAENESIDLSISGAILPDYLIEGSVPFQLNLNNSSGSVLDIFVDEVLQNSLIVSSDNLGGSIDLSSGEHKISFALNPEFKIRETNYFNNFLDLNVGVATIAPDIMIKDVSFFPSSPRIGEEVEVRVLLENIGGSASNSMLYFSVNGENIAANEVVLNYNAENTSFFAFTPSTKFSELVFSVDLADANLENNSFSSALYACGSDQNILIVLDNDANSFAGTSPDSLKYFEDVFTENGYCYSVWSERDKGIPDADFLNSFDLVVWSSGDYWNKVLDFGDEEVLSQFYGSVLFEGSDLAFDSNSSFLEERAGVSFEKDMYLSNGFFVLIIPANPFNIPGEINIVSQKSPFPDSVNTFSNFSNVSAGSWSSGGTAIALHQSIRGKSVFFGFSIDAIEYDSVRKQLLKTAIQWLFCDNLYENCFS